MSSIEVSAVSSGAVGSNTAVVVFTEISFLLVTTYVCCVLRTLPLPRIFIHGCHAFSVDSTDSYYCTWR